MAPSVVALVGGTGKLGGLIATSLLARGAQLRLLVRPASLSKAEALQAAGATVVQGDLDDVASLQALCKGASVVISSLQGGSETIVDAQKVLFDVAREAGARRFIPSSFSYHQDGVAMGQNFNTDYRKQFAAYAEETKGSMEVNHIVNGCFLDNGVLFGFLGAFDLSKNEACLWGDGQGKMNFLTYADTAEYTAEVALDDSQLPKNLQFAAETLTFHELVAKVEAVRAVGLTVKTLGSLDDLTAYIDARKADDPGNIMAYLPHCYYRSMLDGSGRMTQLDNGRYPNVRVSSLEEYMQANPM